jgi:serine/threonine protein kinase
MSSLAATDRPEAPLFSDGLGERVVAVDGATGELLQILRLRPELTAVPSFEFALRERTARLANFRHAYYVRVRRVDRALAPHAGLALVSDHMEGTRLSDILRVAAEKHLQLDVNAALCLVRQLVPAVAVLHENAREVAHGLIAPERLLVTPNARLVILEHVLGSAIEQLQLNRDRLWQEFRVALPPSAGAPRFDHRSDVLGMGLVSLALILGRPLEADEFPRAIPDLLNTARERSALGHEQPLGQPLRSWLARALQLDPRRSFASAPEAMAALEEVVSDDGMYVAAPVALETFLSRYIASLLEPPALPDTRAQSDAAARWTPQDLSSDLDYVSEPDEPIARNAGRPARVEESYPYEDEPIAPVSHQQDGAFRQNFQEPVWPRYGEEPVAEPSWADEPPKPAYVPIDPPKSSNVAPTVSQPAFVPPEAPKPPAAAMPEPPKPAPRDLTDLLGPDPLQQAAASHQPAFEVERTFKGGAAALTDKRTLRKIAVVAAAVLVLAAAGIISLKFAGDGKGAVPALGSLNVQSNPAGVPVFVDGVEHGKTPARVSLTTGSHILELRGRGVPRVIPITVTAGAELSQYLEFAEAPVTAQLAVQSEPAGAKVIVDGTERGVAPVTIPDLAPGEHHVELQADGVSSKHTVTVQAGGTASLVVPIGTTAAAGPVSGWVVVKAPFSMEIREQGRLLGSSDADRVMMAAGRHELDLVNDAVGYHATRVVQVLPGKVVSISLDLPQGVINLNASPWAEVWIDGKRVGETPIGNLAIPIGPHEIVFKHPQYGEKHHSISVTLNTPVRLSVDMK